MTYGGLAAASDRDRHPGPREPRTGGPPRIERMLRFLRVPT